MQLKKLSEMYIAKHRSDPTSLYLIGILLLATVLRFMALDQSFWLDEAAQAVLSKNPFAPGQFNGDFQPPLFYYLTHVWMQLGNVVGWRSEAFLRLLPVSFGIGTVFVLYRLLSELFNKRFRLLAGLMLAVSPFHVYYSQEFRMYSMLTCIVLLSWYFLWKKEWKWFAIASTTGIFTHYFAFVNLGAQIVYILFFDRRNVQKILLSAALSMAPFIFWVPTFLQQLETARHLVEAWPGWKAISGSGIIRHPGLVLAKFTVGMISPANRAFYGGVVGVMGTVSALAFAGLLQAGLRSRSMRQPAIFLLSMFSIPLLLSWIGGIWIPVSSPARIQFVLPAFYGVLAVGLAVGLPKLLALWKAPKNVNISRVAATIASLAVFYILAQNLFFTSQYLLKPANHRENWRQAVAYTDSLAHNESGTTPTDTLILTEFTDPWVPIEWYSQQRHLYTGGSSEQRITPVSVQTRLDPLISGKKTIVLYTYLFEISDPDHHIEAYLGSKGYALKSEKDFKGVGIIKIFVR